MSHGVNFLAFTELALDDVNGGGVIFLATLSGTGVTTANNMAIFAVDNTGTLQLIVRSGDVINDRTIMALTFLPAETFVNGQGRSFDPSSGDLVYNAIFQRQILRHLQRRLSVGLSVGSTMKETQDAS
jgi:hypothetical protein